MELTYPYAHLRLWDKLILLASLAIAGAIFLSVGWLAMAPDDPQGAVSLQTSAQPGLMILQAAGLVLVTAALATVMLGRRLVDVGVFAAAGGMALVTLRGDNAAYLLISVAGADAEGVRQLAGRCALEALAWSGLILLAMMTSGTVLRWCFGSGDRSGNGRVVRSDDMALSEAPLLSALISEGRPLAERRAAMLDGLKVAALMTIIAFFVYGVLVSGYSPRWVRHGQAWFATAAAFYLGVWVSKRWIPLRTVFWRLTAVPLTATAGYLWSMVASPRGGPYDQLASVPTSDFLRALPISFVAVGTLAVLLAHWTIAESPRRSKTATSAGGARRKPAGSR